jgi:serine/threonine-protein phosphatase 2A regulatory subunit B'
MPRRERRRSSIIREERVEALSDLPLLKDTPVAKREALFKQKLALCCVMFNFDIPDSNARGKELKRMTLLELIDYVQATSGQKIFSEAVMPDVVNMVATNLFRALPPQTEDFDPEEDEPVMEPSWPHLQVVYEFFLRFIVSSEVKAKVAKKYVDQKFGLKIIELFDSEDPRERDYLKTILHRIYGKFMSHRSFIRKAISNVFYRFVFETERHNGIGELLEILGSIINGFALPLKKEHVIFLERALIPLHRPKCLGLYHQQLSYCVTQYIEKDAATSVPIILGLIKCWPWANSSKQVLFLNELEEALELIGSEEVEQIYIPLFRVIGKCVGSVHFQVAERALFLWNNEHLINSGCLSRAHSAKVLPIIYGPLFENSQGHWNPTVESLAKNVLKHYMDTDGALFERCASGYERERETQAQQREERDKQWVALEDMAGEN